MRVVLGSDAPGAVVHNGRPDTIVAVHVGRPVRISGKHGTETYAGLAIHGDIELIPAGMSARREMVERDNALLLVLPQALIARVARAMNLDPNRVELRNRFQIRDPRIEHIAWALKVEVEDDFPNTRLYFDSLATALATQLIRAHSSVETRHNNGKTLLLPTALRRVLTYIEQHLSEDLQLPTIADVASLSVSHFKAVFRRSMGVPIHQYVIRRRVDRAAMLLQSGTLSIGQIAIECGFAHQSHLSLHMRRMLGLSPLQYRRLRGDQLQRHD